MDFGEMIYVGAVIAAMIVFAVTLFTVSQLTNRKQ
jgi:hypothetical protein